MRSLKGGQEKEISKRTTHLCICLSYLWGFFFAAAAVAQEQHWMLVTEKQNLKVKHKCENGKKQVPIMNDIVYSLRAQDILQS